MLIKYFTVINQDILPNAPVTLQQSQAKISQYAATGRIRQQNFLGFFFLMHKNILDPVHCKECYSLIRTNINYTIISKFLHKLHNSCPFSKLTSNDCRQYQQKTCLQRLHIIWAQPSFLSIGTWHIGQRLILASSSLLKGMLNNLNTPTSYVLCTSATILSRCIYFYPVCTTHVARLIPKTCYLKQFICLAYVHKILFKIF